MSAKKKVSTTKSDHTHAILVVLAYLIGFITAYIGFGLDYNINHKSKTVVGNQNQGASAYSSVKAVTTDEGLFMSNGDTERIISARSEKTDLSLGYHRDIVATSVSMYGDYIYYCAEMNDEELCHHFIYVKKEDKVYPIMKSGNALVTDSYLSQNVLWLKNNTLQIDQLISIDKTKPWLVE